MPRRRSNPTTTQVESVRHKDKRANIPTTELRDFVKGDEAQPKAVQFPGLLYARDPSLDPQLVWKGKDEQDQEKLTVPAVPIYIQEKIHPQAIIEDIRQTATAGTEQQADLFADFNGINFEKLIDFYQHKDGVNWANRMILGDSLLAMTSLAEKEGLKGKVQMMYFDPPYGIKFGSNWQVSTRKRDVKDGSAEDATRQPEQIRAFRDTWKLGIHSYLSYLRDRLTVARELLTESGSVFVQIGDENVHLVRNILDEVFGSDNFVGQVAFRTTAARGGDFLDAICDYVLWYGKKRESTKYRQIFVERTLEAESNYDWLDNGKEQRELDDLERWTPQEKLSGCKYALADITSQGYTEAGHFEFAFSGRKFRPPATRHWSTTREGMNRLSAAERLQIKGGNLFYRRYLDDYPVRALPNNWEDTASGGFLKGESKIYVVQTNTLVIQRCILMTTDPGDLVLDPTCGSGTTAHVAEQWGRRWITIDTSRVALALSRTRLMAARYPYYLLSDSMEGFKKEAESIGKIPADYRTDGDIKKGFVYKRVPHVTLKSIANNPDIKEGMTRKEIDTAIACHADRELLYDQPYEDNKRVRVTGPFTVESLSPHRVLATDVDRPASESNSEKTQGPGQFETMILENLKKAGVQSTMKKERLVFNRLDTYAGIYLHGTGEYTEGGKSKRVAICIGPEHGTVGPELVKEAAKEAVKGVGFDLLVICGFAFDPHVSEEAKQYGKLTVLTARMNHDLTMGDELLKKTGAGNLFTVFGEPDMQIKKQKDGKMAIEIKGVDVYDPTTGQIRSHSTDDVACWFIDTNYNGESFFVRHAYFCGADEPYEKLKRALRAEVSEEAWASLHSTKSRPFDPPPKGKIAIKIINHYGDEVLKIYELK
jgi:adenine-specific DNA-methyltransferase